MRINDETTLKGSNAAFCSFENRTKRSVKWSDNLSAEVKFRSRSVASKTGKKKIFKTDRHVRRGDCLQAIQISHDL